ncbi:MAG TPA: putative phage tail protein [Stellaceae bacterium]|nr:putative phage tail protein [Stellaceae bacterium]
MSYTCDDYLGALIHLLPPGDAWSREEGTVLRAFIAAFAASLANVDARVDDFIAEMDPRTSLELLPDFEGVYGLPDPCAGPDASLSLRRSQLVSKITSLGNLSIPYTIAAAAAVGYRITVSEPPVITCDGNCDSLLYDDNWAFAFFVHAPAVTVTIITCDETCDTPLQSFGNTLLQCAIKEITPPELDLLFTFG